MKNKFIDRSLIGTLDFIRDAIFAEEHSRLNGIMQALDPRVKLISLIMILFTVAWIKNIAIIFMFYLSSLILVLLSKINLTYFIKRTWIFIPLFSLFIAIPALFNAFSPGEIIFLGITKQGLLSATLFVLRVLTSVSFTVLIVLTTSHVSLLSALGSLGIPGIFVTTFTMCYRYTYIFIKIIQDSYLAIKSRLISNLRYRKAHRIVAWHMATLWERSLAMSEAVYMAMLSRGYSGGSKSAAKFKAGLPDVLWLLGVTLACAIVIYLDAKNAV